MCIVCTRIKGSHCDKLYHQTRQTLRDVFLPFSTRCLPESLSLYLLLLKRQKMYMVQCNKFISFFFEITIKLPFILHLPFLAVEQKKLRSLSQFFTVCWYVLNLGSRFLDFFSTQNCSLGYILTMDHWRFCSWVFPIADRSNITIIKTRNFRFMGCLVSSEILGGRWKQKNEHSKKVFCII